MLSKAYTINYSGESIEDISEIAGHYEEISVSLRLNLRDAILKAEIDLIRNPFAFSKVGFKDFRRILLKKFPYKMITESKTKKFMSLLYYTSPDPDVIGRKD